MKTNRPAESGSVLYWIFIAIALFAALSFAVANINRSGGGKMEELAHLLAADMMQYSAAIQRGIRIMNIEGVQDSEFCFHSLQWGHNNYDDSGDDNDCGRTENQVFHPDGGAIGFQDTEADWYADGATAPGADREWVFSSRFEVEDVGTTGSGAGTEASSADILMATAPVNDSVCEKLNSLLNYNPDTPPAVPANTYSELAANPFNADDVSFTSGAGRIPSHGRERCVADPGGFNMYYKVILAR